MHKRTAHALIDNDDNIDALCKNSTQESSSRNKDKQKRNITRDSGNSSLKVRHFVFRIHFQEQFSKKCSVYNRRLQRKMGKYRFLKQSTI